MKPHLIEVFEPETYKSLIFDMEGPYHKKSEKIGEHIYGCTMYINNIPYHFEKYIPTTEEVERFVYDNDKKPVFQKGGYLYRIVPFAQPWKIKKRSNFCCSQ